MIYRKTISRRFSKAERFGKKREHHLFPPSLETKTKADKDNEDRSIETRGGLYKVKFWCIVFTNYPNILFLCRERKCLCSCTNVSCHQLSPPFPIIFVTLGGTCTMYNVEFFTKISPPTTLYPNGVFALLSPLLNSRTSDLQDRERKSRKAERTDRTGSWWAKIFVTWTEDTFSFPNCSLSVSVSLMSHVVCAFDRLPLFSLLNWKCCVQMTQRDIRDGMTQEAQRIFGSSRIRECKCTKYTKQNKRGRVQHALMNITE